MIPSQQCFKTRCLLLSTNNEAEMELSNTPNYVHQLYIFSLNSHYSRTIDSLTATSFEGVLFKTVKPRFVCPGIFWL